MEIQSIKLDKERKDTLINTLLKYMKEKAEEQGRPINLMPFDFTPSYTQQYFNEPDEIIPDAENLADLKTIINITNEEIVSVIRICTANEYIKNKCLGSETSCIHLTSKGMARANSLDNAIDYKPHTNTQYNFHGAVNLNNSAIGNGNTINIENSIETILKLIEETRTTQEEKKTLKTQFTAFLKHPAITPILAKYGIDIIQKIKGIF